MAWRRYSAREADARLTAALTRFPELREPYLRLAEDWATLARAVAASRPGEYCLSPERRES